MPRTHRGEPTGGNHQPTPRIGLFTNKMKWYGHNPRTAPFEDSDARKLDTMGRISAADDDFQSYERIPGTKKHYGWHGPQGYSSTEYEGSRPVMRSIDRVGPYYSPTVYDITNDMSHESQVGYWTKSGAKKKSKGMLANDVEHYSIEPTPENIAAANESLKQPRGPLERDLRRKK